MRVSKCTISGISMSCNTNDYIVQTTEQILELVSASPVSVEQISPVLLRFMLLLVECRRRSRHGRSRAATATAARNARVSKSTGFRGLCNVIKW